MTKKTRGNHTGFVAIYDDGTEVVEKNNYYDPNLKRIKATNWHEVLQPKVLELQLWWRGELKVDLIHTPDVWRWIFSHKGSATLGSSPRTLSRLIGFVNTENASRLNTWEVDEETGKVSRIHKT